MKQSNIRKSKYVCIFYKTQAQMREGREYKTNGVYYDIKDAYEA